MTDLNKLREEAKAAEKKVRDLYTRREEAQTDQYVAEKEIWSLPCDTRGWTDEELSSHMYHMHDDKGYIHVQNLPRPLAEKIHDLIKDMKRRPRSEV